MPSGRRRGLERRERIRGLMIRPGEEWSRPSVGEPDDEVAGDDAALARCVQRAATGSLVRFIPSPASDLARAVGLTGPPDGSLEVALDALDFGDGTLATNVAVAGTTPDHLTRRARSFPVEVVVDGVSLFSGPATTVVVAVGQFLRGADLVPRGHPGDGRAEVQVYAVTGRDRRRLRARLRRGDHVPHPQIAQRPGRRIEISSEQPVPWEADGVPREPAADLRIEVLPARYRLLL
jgi:YegS C-terminal NAD kinase beta sandwich-like domain